MGSVAEAARVLHALNGANLPHLACAGECLQVGCQLAASCGGARVASPAPAVLAAACSARCLPACCWLADW